MTAAVSSENAFPRLFGSYVLVSHLGDGGMGRVYLALTRTEDGGERLCVVKRFGNPRAHFAPDQVEENKERFRREALLTMKLDHPSIPRTFTWVHREDQAFLVQEFIRGVTVEYLLSRMAAADEHLPMPLVAHIVTEIASALDYLHQFRGWGLVHRDLTSSNVMCSLAGAVKVIDFGIAKATLAADASLTRPNILVGKPLWTAPEVLEGQHPDRRADLYALGLLFWCLAAGRNPERDLPDDSTTSGGATTLPPPSTFNLETSKYIDELVRKAIDCNPERRFQTAKEFIEAVAPIIPTAYQGQRELATTLSRYQPALQNKFFAEVVGRARPLLDQAAPLPSKRRKYLVVLVVPALLVAAVVATYFRFPSSAASRVPVSLPAPTSPTPPSVIPRISAAPPVANILAIAQKTPSSPSTSQPIAPTPTEVRARSHSPRVQSEPSIAREPRRHDEPPEQSQPTLPSTESAQSLLDAAIVATTRREIPKALSLARASVRAQPTTAGYLLLGRLLLASDPPGARDAFEEALRLSPGNGQAKNLLRQLNRDSPPTP
jgi:serine/threonine protein kinase